MQARVAICVVYLVDDAFDFLLEAHLAQIKRCSGDIPLRIYAGINRLAPRYLEQLKQHDFITICDLPDTDARGSFEHAFYLDRLIGRAIRGGASHICTLDVDSFPISSDWLSAPLAALEKGSSLVGILRRENGDFAAPHPSFMLFPTAFLTEYRPTFSPLANNQAAIAFSDRTGQRLDTGAGYALVLDRYQLPWTKMLRSNVRDLHPLLGGIYDGRIFHFGGGNRDKVFTVDVREARRMRPSAEIGELWPEIAARNHQIALDMLSAMRSDLDGFMRHLQTGD